MGRTNLLALAASISFFAIAATAQGQTHEQLVERYTDLAGSKENAESLVRGLRDGETVTLSYWPGSVILIPPTGKMSNANVEQALGLAQASLAKHGLTDPTAPELAYALMGGNIKTPVSGTLAFGGVLKLRAAGKGWGQIAQAYGVKLGEAKASTKATPASPRSAPKAVRVAGAKNDAPK